MLSVEGAELLLVDGTLHALDPASGKTRWEAPARGLPVAGAGGRGSVGLLVPEERGFAHLDAGSGDRLGTSAVSDVPAGGTASGAGPVIVYRLSDRVLAYQ
jgi:outer membrane protein assembly factor BamB